MLLHVFGVFMEGFLLFGLLHCKKVLYIFLPCAFIDFFFQFTIDLLSPDTAYKITVTGNSTSGEIAINSTNVSTGKL